MTKAEQHAEHMDRVRAVHRRSAFERVLAKIAWYQSAAHPPLEERDQEQLRCLLELREVIREEMIEHGQIDA